MIALALTLLAVASVSPVASAPPIAPDSIWENGFAEVTFYSMTSKDDLKGSEWFLDIRRHPVERSDAGGSDFVERKTLGVSFSPVGPESASDTLHPKVTVTFQRDGFRPMYEIAYPSRRHVVAQTPGEVFYDGLPAWLRGFDLTKPARFQVLLVPTLLSDDSTTTKPMSAEIEIVGPAGPPSMTSHGGLQVNVNHVGEVDHLWFHPGPGHRLLVWEKGNGTTLTFYKSMRQPIE